MTPLTPGQSVELLETGETMFFTGRILRLHGEEKAVLEAASGLRLAAPAGEFRALAGRARP